MSLANGWQPITTAPKDGTLVLLLISAVGVKHPTEDTIEASRTIGHNNFDNDGVDQWLFAGWCWEHDHYIQGKGEPLAWQPFPKGEL